MEHCTLAVFGQLHTTLHKAAPFNGIQNMARKKLTQYEQNKQQGKAFMILLGTSSLQYLHVVVRSSMLSVVGHTPTNIIGWRTSCSRRLRNAYIVWYATKKSASRGTCSASGHATCKVTKVNPIADGQL